MLPGVEEENVRSVMDEINNNIAGFNESGAEPFAISVAMGYAQFTEHDDAETFLTHMDAKMYEEKRRFYALRDK